MLIGAIVSSGGGVIVGTISGTTANWTFSTPPFLRSGAGWDGTLDVWGGALVGTQPWAVFLCSNAYTNLQL